MRILKDIAITSVSHTISTITVLLVQILLVRTVAIDAYGQYAFLQGMIALIESIVITRAGEVAIYSLGKDWGVNFAKAKITSFFLFRQEFLWNFIAYFFVVLIAFVIPKSTNINSLMLLLIGLSIPLQSGYGVTKSIFIVSGKIREQAKFEIASSITYLIVSTIAIIQYGLYGFIVGALAAAAVKSQVSLLISRKFWPKNLDLKNQLIQKPQLTVVSFHSILRNIFLNISNQVDILVLGIFGTTSSVALYRIAKTLASIPTRLAAPVWSALRPRLLEALRYRNLSRIRYLVCLPALVFFILGLCSIPIFLQNSKYIIQTVYGITYVPAVAPFLILLVGSWIFNMVSGWIVFFAIVVPKKKFFNTLFLIQCVAVVLSSIAVKGSIINMSIAISVIMISISVIAWFLILTSSNFMDFRENEIC